MNAVKGCKGVILTEDGEQNQAEQQQKVCLDGAGAAAVHSVFLTGAHLNFEIRVVGYGRDARVGQNQRQVVVGLFKTVQQHDLRVGTCRGPKKRLICV